MDSDSRKPGYIPNEIIQEIASNLELRDIVKNVERILVLRIIFGIMIFQMMTLDILLIQESFLILYTVENYCVNHVLSSKTPMKMRTKMKMRTTTRRRTTTKMKNIQSKI